MLSKDEIIEMARQIATQASKVGPYRTWTHEYAMSLIMQLVDASAAKEREACAKVCEDIFYAPEPEGCGGDEYYYTRPYLDCAEAIRARGQL